mgnify:CR=1 FL=1
MQRILGFAALALCVTLACSSNDASSPAAGTGSVAGTGGIGGATGDSGVDLCQATFTWLQKDAYKETAGRSSPLWPPHTTTTLDITCDGTVVRSAFRENHGTLPGEKDKNGDVFLVPVGKIELSGPRAELDALANAYEACECGTKFLSMDALSDTVVQQLVAELSAYVTAHLTCTGPDDAAALVKKLQAGDIEGVLVALPNCTWDSGSDFSGGFDAALKAVVAASEKLSDYHVCNNDAALQASLVDAYRKGTGVSSCDTNSPLCQGPMWFYNPSPP